MNRRKPLASRDSKYDVPNIVSYNRFIFGSGVNVPTTPASMGGAGALTVGVPPGGANPPQSSNNTPPILPPPNAAAIYDLITNLEEFLITEAGDNITTQLQ